MVGEVSRRVQVARWLERAGVIEGFLRLRALAPSPWLPILSYHRVAPLPPDHAFEDGVIDATPEEFDRQVAMVTRYFNVIGSEQLCAWAEGGKLPPNPLAITFDDGYRDNHAAALPILARHGARAIFFVSTAYVTERRLFWWDRIAYLLKRSARARIEVDYPAPLVVELKGDRAPAISAVRRLVRDQPGLDIERFLVELGRAAEVAFDAATERRLADELLMTWDEVRALRAAGMDVESHTRTHRVLQTLSPGEIKDELSGSRADLERELGGKVRALSYPVGKAIANVPAIREAVRDAGYQIGFSNASGVNPRWRSSRFDRFDVRRLSMELGLPHPFFRGMLAIPFLSA